MADPRPLVLLIDEIDALVGDTLLSVLRQLRTGYDQRPAAFPHSIVLCGVRDVRDYRIHSSAEDRLVLGGSAFNIKSKSLRLGDFSEQEVRELLAQHTAATGQAFTEEALRRWRQDQEGRDGLRGAGLLAGQRDVGPVGCAGVRHRIDRRRACRGGRRTRSAGPRRDRAGLRRAVRDGEDMGRREPGCSQVNLVDLFTLTLTASTSHGAGASPSPIKRPLRNFRDVGDFCVSLETTPS